MIEFTNNKYIESINILNDSLFVERHEINASSLLNCLLSMLMNGQVSVGDVEEQLRMVAEEGENYKRS